MKLPFSRKPDDAQEPPPGGLTPRARPPRQSRLMSEASVHWGRGVAIVIGIVAIIVVFLIVLTVLPKPGNGNPLDSLSNILSNNSNVATGTPVSGTAVAGAAVVGGTAPALATVTSAARGAATGTPTEQFVAAAAHGAPNVRSAPSTNNNPLGNLQPGRNVVVLGRSADNAWLQIVWDNNAKAWVAQDLMVFVRGSAAQLPVVAP